MGMLGVPGDQHAIEFKGPLSVVFDIVDREPALSWILVYPETPIPSRFKGIQAGILEVLSTNEKCSDIEASVTRKLQVTIG